VESQTLVEDRRSPGHRRWADSPGLETVVLGRYRLLERLGAGGFGVVWRAHDELLDREVAVKRIPLAPEEDGERATREALATARLSHPAIVALYEACPAPDAFYLISELVRGETLAQLIAAGALGDEQVLRIGIALSSALAHAHERGVIHRDVKPQNVLVPERPEVPAQMPEALGELAKLTDFGGARLSGQEVLTRTGDVLGTLAYMAPEQSEGREVGEQTDLYSLALVLYEALCGFNPVRGSSPAETVRRIGRPIPPLERARRDLPRPLTRAVDRCLASAGAERGTVDQLRLTFEHALAGATLPAPVRRKDRRRAVRDVEQEAHEPPAVEPEEEPRRAAGLRLPRGLLLGCALALCVWQAASGRPGVALLAFAAFLPLAVLPLDRRSPGGSAGWLSALLAPVLGLIGLAGAFPAIAGQAARWRMRASLGALGYWWLVLAEALLARHLWLGPHAGTPARAVWEGSVQSAATHVLGPVLSLGVLLGAALWALAAMLLPLLVRGRNAALDIVGATVWSAALVAATPAIDSGLSPHAAHVSPHGAILGAVFGGVLAVAARALRGPV
jgi:eukaryotic-like serine/threonine-protein kinase